MQDEKEGLIKGNPYAIDTYTGRIVNPASPDPDDISITDIAHSLSLLCRFTGHCKWFYSVGTHSINVQHILTMSKYGFSYENNEELRLTRLAGLLHDAPEAYVNDLSRPVKHLFRKYTDKYDEMEKRLMGAITAKFHLSGANWTYVKRADNIMVMTEAFQLMPDNLDLWDMDEKPIEDFPAIGISNPHHTETAFLTLYDMLKKD